MISSSTRMTAPLARQALRQPYSRLSMRVTQRRLASSGPAQAAKSTAQTAKSTANAAKEAAKSSDAPWAIGSLVVFGSLFVYLTSPPKGGKKGHGHDDHSSHGKDDEADTDDTSDSGGEEADGDTSADEREYFVDKKIEDKPDPAGDAPAGSHLLAKNSLSAEEGAHKQKTTKSASDLSKPDNITFQKGVAAAKEGHTSKEDGHISDPKKVVADAHTERQDRKQKASGDKDAKEAKKAQGDVNAQDANAQNKNTDKEQKESQDVHDSANAADANAQNEKSEEERKDSEEVHNSENAKKANAINEEEGSDKED